MTSLKGWPAAERPRERLFQHGVDSLSDAELLALFLRSGTVGSNAKDLALRLLESFDGLKGLARRSPDELLGVSGLGPAKIGALIASFEIGRRMLKEEIRQRPVIESAQDLFQFLQQSLGHEREEVFSVVSLNARNELVKVLTISRGDPTRVVLSIPQVIRRLVLEGSAAAIFVHNHPSGDPTPSEEDKRLTKRLLKSCRAVEIAMHDHLIIGSRGCFFSFAQEGLLA